MKRSFKLQFFKFGVCIYLWGWKYLRQGEMSHGKKTYTAVHRLYTNDGSDILNRIFGYLESAEKGNGIYLKIFQNFIAHFSQSALKNHMQ